MGRIVAIAGGDLKTTHKINQYIVALTKKENPNFLFIGTASCDAEEYISNIHDEFEPLGCSVKELNIATKRYSENKIDIVDGEDAEGNDNMVFETNQGEIRWFEEKDIQTIGIQK